MILHWIVIKFLHGPLLQICYKNVEIAEEVIMNCTACTYYITLIAKCMCA